MERRLRVTEPVIKFLTVRVDKEQARMAKLKERRKAPAAPPETGGEPAAVTA
jgi:small subunit ribosomal protein S6